MPKGAHKGDDAILNLPDRGLAARCVIQAEPQKVRPGWYSAPVGEIVLLSPSVPLTYLREHHPAWKWLHYPRSFTTIDGQIEMRLDELIRGYRPEPLPPETEGDFRYVVLTVYERNPKARRRCLDHYGTNCYGCGLSFGKIYGNIAEGFIHGHHLREVSGRGGKYVVDPVKDLRPICPNCHAVVHL